MTVAAIKTKASSGRAWKSEPRGYALLLLVFFMTLMTIAMGVAAPNIIMQGRREKEKEMIWRGKQYVRGIRLYYQKTGHFPTQLEDLYKPKTGIRFMRQPYKDPVNGADGSWRLIYVAPNGQLIGSLKERRNAFFFGAQPSAAVGAALSPLSASADAGKNPFAAQSQTFPRLAPDTDNSSFSAASTAPPNNSPSSDQALPPSTNTPTAPGPSGPEALPVPPAQSFGSMDPKRLPTAAIGDVSTTAAAGYDSARDAFEPANTAGESVSDLASPAAQPLQRPIAPVALIPSNSSSPLETQPVSSGPTFGQTIIIGVGSKINKTSIMRYDGEKNYLHFEFLWDGLTAASGVPAQ